MSSEIQPAQQPPHSHSAAAAAEKANIEHVQSPVGAGGGDVDAKAEANFRADAMEAESAEHRMTVLEAVKAYPWACFWAFTMSSTIIVSGPEAPAPLFVELRLC